MDKIKENIEVMFIRIGITLSLVFMFCINIFGYISLIYWFSFCMGMFIMIFGNINSNNGKDFINNTTYVKLYGYEILLTCVFPYGFIMAYYMIKGDFNSPIILLDIIMGDDDYSYNKFKIYVDKHCEE